MVNPWIDAEAFLVNNALAMFANLKAEPIGGPCLGSVVVGGSQSSGISVGARSEPGSGGGDPADWNGRQPRGE